MNKITLTTIALLSTSAFADLNLPVSDKHWKVLHSCKEKGWKANSKNFTDPLSSNSSNQESLNKLIELEKNLPKDAKGNLITSSFNQKDDYDKLSKEEKFKVDEYRSLYSAVAFLDRSNPYSTPNTFGASYSEYYERFTNMQTDPSAAMGNGGVFQFVLGENEYGEKGVFVTPPESNNKKAIFYSLKNTKPDSNGNIFIKIKGKKGASTYKINNSNGRLALGGFVYDDRNATISNVSTKEYSANKLQNSKGYISALLSSTNDVWKLKKPLSWSLDLSNASSVTSCLKVAEKLGDNNLAFTFKDNQNLIKTTIGAKAGLRKRRRILDSRPSRKRSLSSESTNSKTAD